MRCVGSMFGSAGLAAFPAERTRITAKQIAFLDLGFCDRKVAFRAMRDIERIDGTIDFAEVAGLAIVLARDDGCRIRHRVEDIGRANLDADIAFDATACGDNLDHDAMPSRLICASPMRIASTPLTRRRRRKCRIVAGTVCAPVHAAAFIAGKRGRERPARRGGDRCGLASCARGPHLLREGAGAHHSTGSPAARCWCARLYRRENNSFRAE